MHCTASSAFCSKSTTLDMTRSPTILHGAGLTSVVDMIQYIAIKLCFNLMQTSLLLYNYMAFSLDTMQLFCCSYLLLLLAGGSSVVNGFTQVTVSAMITSQCGVQDDPQLVASLRQVEQLIGPTRNQSCFEILQCPLSAPSGYMYYQIQTANNSCVHVQVYCDLEGTNCGRSYVSMTQAGATCSQELTQ